MCRHPTSSTGCNKVNASVPDRGHFDLDNLPSIWRRTTKIEWLVDGLLPLGSVTLLSAASGTGKTWLAHGIAGAVAHGQPFLGRAVAHRPVRYFDGENPDCVVKARLSRLAFPRIPISACGVDGSMSHPKTG